MAVGGARDRGSALEWGLSRTANCFRDPQEVPERLCLRREGRARSPLILFGYRSLLFYICLKSRLLLGVHLRDSGSLHDIFRAGLWVLSHRMH